MIFQFGEYKIDVDVEKTRQFYDRAKTVSEGCQCDGCLNFERAVDKLPQNIRDFFSALGVDMKKICECYVYCAKDENTLYYGGFCHICGTLLSGKSAWKPTSDSTACWDGRKQPSFQSVLNLLISHNRSKQRFFRNRYIPINSCCFSVDWSTNWCKWCISFLSSSPKYSLLV